MIERIMSLILGLAIGSIIHLHFESRYVTKSDFEYYVATQPRYITVGSRDPKRSHITIEPDKKCKVRECVKQGSCFPYENEGRC